jgi:hypothetical protein
VLSFDNEETGDASTAPGVSVASAFAYRQITAGLRCLRVIADGDVNQPLSPHMPSTFWKLWTGSSSTSS